MKYNDAMIANEIIGCSHAMLTLVLKGERQFGLEFARRAKKHFGGGLELWMDPKGDTAKRRELIDAFKNKH